ncbi:hypothetical protein V2J09_015683 [Rumex salicifolius]
MENVCFQFVFAHVPPTAHRRKVFRKVILAELIRVAEPIFFEGDLNCIVDYSERFGSSGHLHNDTGNFRELIDDLGLIDMGFSGQSFTWSRGLSTDNFLSKRLDWIPLNSVARLLWPKASLCHLPKFSSDHTPLLLYFKPSIAWLTHPDFDSFLEINWNHDQPATSSLANLRRKLGKWNKDVFGNIHERK